MRVLIVESEALAALDFDAAVREMGFEVAGVARSGPEALRMALTAKPDIAIVDMRLADGLTGNVLAVDFAWSGAAPILITGAPDLVTEDARDACVALLAKPVAPRSLRAALAAAARCVDAGRAAADTAA